MDSITLLSGSHFEFLYPSPHLDMSIFFIFDYIPRIMGSMHLEALPGTSILKGRMLRQHTLRSREVLFQLVMKDISLSFSTSVYKKDCGSHLEETTMQVWVINFLRQCFLVT